MVAVVETFRLIDLDLGDYYVGVMKKNVQNLIANRIAVARKWHDLNNADEIRAFVVKHPDLLAWMKSDEGKEEGLRHIVSAIVDDVLAGRKVEKWRKMFSDELVDRIVECCRRP